MRRGLCFAGLCLLLIAVGVPGEWYESLPRNSDLPSPPVSGLMLLRLSFGVEALLLFWLSFRSRSGPLVGVPLMAGVGSVAVGGRLGERAAATWLTGITLFGLMLRLWRLDADLWLDEIAPLVLYGQMSTAEVMASYLGSNNHLLNTLLVNLSVTVFGEHEWSARLPAVVFGAATIPAVYWAARMVLTRASSVVVALFLSVSYHHIFFSQNARGYTAYVFFALVSSVLLCKALGDGRRRAWALYAGAMFLGMASLLISAFVFASHVIVSGGALLVLRSRGQPLPAAVRRFATVFAVTALLVFQLYAMIIPKAFVYMQSVYTEAGSGYALVSVEFVSELARGVLVAFGAGVDWTIVPVLIMGIGVGCLGWSRLARRDWPLMVGLTLPGVFTVLLVLLGGLSVSPRLFLLALPLSMLVIVEAVSAVAGAVGRLLAGDTRRDGWPLWLSLGSAVTMSGLLLLPLADYYATPKQAYVASAEYVQRERTADDVVAVVHLAEMGYRYYGPRFGLDEGRRLSYLRSKEALDSILDSHPHGSVLLVTTFPRALRLAYPDLAASIEQGWSVARVFPGTIGDGDIAIWKPR